MDEELVPETPVHAPPRAVADATSHAVVVSRRHTGGLLGSLVGLLREVAALALDTVEDIAHAVRPRQSI